MPKTDSALVKSLIYFFLKLRKAHFQKDSTVNIQFAVMYGNPRLKSKKKNP